MKVSIFSCAVTFVAGWLIGCLFIYTLLTSIDQQQEGIRHHAANRDSLIFHEFMKRERDIRGAVKDLMRSEPKYLGFREQYLTASTSPPVSSFDRINQLFQSYHFPFISSSSLSSSWIFHPFSSHGSVGDDDSKERDPNGENSKLYIFLDWPFEDSRFTIHNYHSLQTLLATFPQAIIRCLLPVPSASRSHTNNQVPRTMAAAWDEEHDRQKYPGILAKRQFQLYRKLGYDIDTISALDTNSKIFNLFTFGQSYRKKWFSTYRKILLQQFHIESSLGDDASRGHFSHNDDEREENEQSQTKDFAKNNPLLPPYHLLTYIRLVYLWKKGGMFMDFSFIFRNNPFNIADLDRGYYINSYCFSEKKSKDSTIAVYRPKSFDSWRDLECSTSTFFLFRYPHDDLLTCVLKKYDDEIFQVCIESDPFYGGAECILKAFHQCTVELDPSFYPSRDDTPGKGQRRHYFGKNVPLIERYNDDPLTAKEELMQDVVNWDVEGSSQNNETSGASIGDSKEALDANKVIEQHQLNTAKNLENTTFSFTSSPLELQTSSAKFPLQKVGDSLQGRHHLFNLDEASILWMGHLGWQSTWNDYPYPPRSSIDFFVQPAKAITHHHLKFLRRKIRMVEESIQQQNNLVGLNEQSSESNLTMNGIVVSLSHNPAMKSSSVQRYQPKSCFPYATSLTLPSSEIPIPNSIVPLHHPISNIFASKMYDVVHRPEHNSNVSSLTVIGNGISHEILSQHLRGSRQGRTPSPLPSAAPSIVSSMATNGEKNVLHDAMECSPSIYMIGFKDTGSEIVRKLLDGNPFILSGWSSETHSKSQVPPQRSKRGTKAADIPSAEKNDHYVSKQEPIVTKKELWQVVDQQLLGRLSSFIVEEHIGCYSAKSELNTRSQCFPFIESSSPVADNYNGNSSEWLPNSPSSLQKSIDKYSPASIFHLMDASLTYNIDPITPFVIKQDNPNAKALFIISNPIDRIVRALHKHRLDLQIFLNEDFDNSIDSPSPLEGLSLDDMVLLLMDKSKTGVSQYRKLLLSQQVQQQHTSHGNGDQNDKMDAWLERYFGLLFASHGNRTLSFFEELFYHSIYFPAIIHYTRVLGMSNTIVIDIDDLIFRDFFRKKQMEEMAMISSKSLSPMELKDRLDNLHMSKNVTVFFQDVFQQDILRSLYARIGVPYAEPATSSHFFKSLLLDMEKEFVLFDHSLSKDVKLSLSKDVYRKLLNFFIPFVEVLEHELELNLTLWKTAEDGPGSYYSYLEDLSYGWNTTRPLLWFETGYEGSEEDDEIEESTGKILPHLLPQSITEEDNGFNTTLGMLNTF